MHLAVVYLLWVLEQLAIPLLFIALAVEWGLASWFAIKIHNNNQESDELNVEGDDTVASVWSEFWKYCLPLIPYAWLGFFYQFADRWMLQHWGGDSEQAYYALAKQFAVISLLATSSMLRIFWKEISEAYYQNNLERVRRLYKSISHILYSIGAIITGALIPWSEEILELFVGIAYLDGATTLMLMLIYPVHQSMGQIGATILYATKEVGLQTILGMIFMIISLVVAYFMMAPINSEILPGMGLASQGLAWKMVVLQVIQVNILAWFIARKFDWKFDWSFQFISLGGALTLGWVVKIAVLMWPMPIITAMIIFGFVYIFLVVVLVYVYPFVICLNKKLLIQLLLIIIDKIRPLFYKVTK
jgi:O-antigen/teichoic acid export membrane protein